MSVVYLAEHVRLGTQGGAEAPRARARGQRAVPRSVPARVEARRVDRPSEHRSDLRRGRGRGVLYIAMRYVEAPTSSRRSATRAGSSRCARPRSSTRSRAPRCRPCARARPSRREAGERLAHPDDHAYVSDFGLTKRAVGERAHGDGPAHRDDRLRRGTDQGRSRRPPRRRVLARVPALRMPDRACALPATSRWACCGRMSRPLRRR